MHVNAYKVVVKKATRQLESNKKKPRMVMNIQGARGARSLAEIDVIIYMCATFKSPRIA